MFPPTTGPGADPLHTTEPYNFEFTQASIPAESVAQFISQHSVHTPQAIRPYDYSKLLIGTGATIVGLAILKLAFKTLKPAIYSRNLWAAISLVLILLFTSGHMFNHIRRVPYVANNGRGGVSYIAGGFSNQFGLETQIIAVICMFSGKHVRGVANDV
jgi:oligosaccharyltransferase complex subunit gamma